MAGTLHPILAENHHHWCKQGNARFRPGRARNCWRHSHLTTITDTDFDPTVRTNLIGAEAYE